MGSSSSNKQGATEAFALDPSTPVQSLLMYTLGVQPKTVAEVPLQQYQQQVTNPPAAASRSSPSELRRSQQLQVGSWRL